MAFRMDTNNSFQIANDSQWIAPKFFNTSIVWKISSLNTENAHPIRYITSPAFRCSKLSWKLCLYPNIDCSFNPMPQAPFIRLIPEGNVLSPIRIRYFKIIVSENSKRIVFKYVGEDRLIRREAGTGIEITINTVGNEKLFHIIPFTISFNFYVEDEFHPTATKVLKEIDIKGSGSSDGSTKELLDKCGSRGCMSVCSDFEKLFNSCRFSDVTLKLTDGEFQAHKVVLCARSKVFAAMFEHDTKEKRTGNVNLVEMEVKTVHDMLRYMYCGKVRDLSPEEALNLFVAADRYDLQELKTFCRGLVLNGISTSNVCDIAAVADLHEDEILIKKLKCFLFKNGKEVIKTKKWKTMSTERQSLCIKMFEWAFSE